MLAIAHLFTALHPASADILVAPDAITIAGDCSRTLSTTLTFSGELRDNGESEVFDESNINKSNSDALNPDNSDVFCIVTIIDALNFFFRAVRDQFFSKKPLTSRRMGKAARAHQDDQRLSITSIKAWPS